MDGTPLNDDLAFDKLEQFLLKKVLAIPSHRMPLEPLQLGGIDAEHLTWPQVSKYRRRLAIPLVCMGLLALQLTPCRMNGWPRCPYAYAMMRNMVY
eukprot:1586208-Amphidinium_carterae.1